MEMEMKWCRGKATGAITIGEQDSRAASLLLLLYSKLLQSK